MKLEKVVEHWTDHRGHVHEREFTFDDQGRLVEKPKQVREKVEVILERIALGDIVGGSK